MNIKLKVGISIFAAVIVIYSFYYIYNEFAQINKANNGYIENYVNSETSMYDQRVEILNIIDSLNVDDKDVKGKLLEKTMSKESLTTMNSYSKDQKTEYIKNLLILLKTKDIDVSNITKPENIQSVDNINVELKSLEKELEDLKKVIHKGSKPNEYYEDPLLPSLRSKVNANAKTVLPEGQLNDNKTDSEPIEYTEKPKTVETFEDFVQGWENITEYALYTKD
jgi:hypothetical protein